MPTSERLRRLARGEDGAIMVMGIFMCSCLVGALWYLAGIGDAILLGLPGNPVSSYICAYLFLVPLIRALSGRTQIDHVFEQATLGRQLPANDQRQDYLRARLDAGGDGLPVATSVGAQDSSLVANLAAAQALIVRPPFVPAAPAGSTCTILRLPN